MSPVLSLVPSPPPFLPNAIVYVIRRTEDVLAPARGTVIRAEEDGYILDVPEHGGQSLYKRADIYPSDAAAALVLAQEKLAEATNKADRLKGAVDVQTKLVDDAKREVANLQKAAAGAAPPPKKAAPKKAAATKAAAPAKKAAPKKVPAKPTNKKARAT
jgi:mannose/cellobiose epimerase-like protein (N-acyl-D-glucosamine 2-epimerase family)